MVFGEASDATLDAYGDYGSKDEYVFLRLVS